MATPEKLMQYAWGYSAPLIIEAAVRNRVFETLSEGGRRLDEIAAATGCSERGLSAILNALVGFELLTRDSAGRYSLAEDSAEFLVSSKPGYLGGFFRHTSQQILPRWMDLADVVRTGKPARGVNEEREGADFFEHFVGDLFPLNYPAACAAANALGVASATQQVRVLDLAAGSGVWSIAVAQRSPWVTVTAVDWPGVLEVTRGFVNHFGLTERYGFVPGDLASAEFGSGHHIALLGHILHSEGEERSRALLRRAAASLAPGGVIAVADFLVDGDRRAPVQALTFAVNMLVTTEAGNTYSFDEVRGWLEEAGFGNVGVVPAPGPATLIFANKPPAY